MDYDRERPPAASLSPAFVLRVVLSMLLRVPRFDFIHNTLAGRPRRLIAAVSVIAVLVFLAGGWAAWFSYDLTAGLPDRNALKALGDMAQATTIFDAADKPAFTIFKEQRIEVPLDEDLAEPDQGGRLGRGSALLRAQRRRRRPRRGAPSSGTSRRGGARRAAARSRSSSRGRAS